MKKVIGVHDRPYVAGLDAKCWRSYQKLEATYLTLAAAFGTLTVLFFYLLDALSGRQSWAGLRRARGLDLDRLTDRLAHRVGGGCFAP